MWSPNEPGHSLKARSCYGPWYASDRDAWASLLGGDSVVPRSTQLPIPIASVDSVHAAILALVEPTDGSLQICNKKDKFDLVIVVDQTGVKETDLPFALVDGTEVGKAFAGFGYKPPVKDQPIGLKATQGNVNATSEKIHDLPEWATVIVYYSGHDVTDSTAKDVWLQLAGQDVVSDHLSISVSGLVEKARGASYLGELHLIIDACFSGRGAFTGELTLKEFGKNTTILTSSEEVQSSYPIKINSRPTMSAFTHTLLRALGPKWQNADDSSDGILQFSEPATFSRIELKKYLDQCAVEQKMQPQLLGMHHDDIFIGYRRDRVIRWDTATRQALTLVALERSLIPPLTAKIAEAATKPEIPQEATGVLP